MPSRQHIASLVSRAGMNFEYAKERLAICEICENMTWLKDAEFTAWLVENKIEVVKFGVIGKVERFAEKAA